MRRLAPARTTVLGAVAGAVALAATVAVAAALVVGPPWISIEYPPNPLDPTTRGAFLLVHTFHHERAVAQALQGRAEGIVDGERRTVALEFGRTSRPGVFALRRMWPAEGTWILAITAGGEDGATALVTLAPDGQVASVRVPTARYEGRFEGPRRVTAQEVEAMLRHQAQLAARR